MSDPKQQVSQVVDQTAAQVKSAADNAIKTTQEVVKNVKDHPFRNIFIGIGIGFILAGFIFGYLWFDSQAKSNEIIAGLRQSERSAITELGGLADTIGQLKSTGNAIKDNAERSRVIINSLGKVIALFPDVK
jgi:hypothetical protein